MAPTPADAAERREAAASETNRWLLFSVGRVEYAIAARDVRRSLPAPEAPGPELEFLGKAYPVLDLRALFGLPPSPRRRFSLLVESGDRHAGLFVDAIGGLVQLASASIMPMPKALTGTGRRWFQGLAVVGGRVLVVVQTERLLSAEPTPRSSPSPSPLMSRT